MKQEIINFNEYCKNFICDNIEDYIGQNHYLSDLGYAITQGINIDGSATYNTWLAIEHLKEWWDEAADYIEWENDAFGRNIHNPFANPEAFMVCMIIYGVDNLIHQCELQIDEDGEIEITSELCDKITEQIKDFKIEF